MKKIIILSISGSFVILLLLIVTAIYISFKTVKPTTEKINHDLERYFTKIIYIPKGIPPPGLGFDETSYFWEMETLQNEVTAVRLRYTPAFPKNQNTIQLVLELPENGDPSIFNKVMPAVVADRQSLDSAQDPQKANLNTNANAPYDKISLFTKQETNQTVRIVWEFKKEALGDEINKEYSKLALFPPTLLKFLYGLPHFILSLFSA